MACTSRRLGIVTLLLAVTGCAPNRPPPPETSFAGLPVTGDMAAARRAGFTRCINMDAVNVRCRKSGIRLFGQGPYVAALDMRGSEGQSGFRHVTVWSDEDQRALYQVPAALTGQGWRFCYTGSDRAGDQAVFEHPDVPFVMFMDISYWGKRRIRIYPRGSGPRLVGACQPAKNLSIFGLNTAL